MKTHEEVAEQLVAQCINPYDVSKAINNTHVIADMCDARIATGLNLMPTTGVDDEMFELRRLCNAGWTKRLQERRINGTQDEADRVFYELGVIEHSGYAGYFLIVEDFINYAKNIGMYVGGGRGSAAGSFVAFLIGITNINPFDYGLLFERFLNPERLSMPDIDTDFDYERRSEVFEYVKRKYGADKVAHIMAQGTMTAKAVCRKVLSAYDYDVRAINSVCKMIPDELNMTLEKAMNNPAFQDWCLHNAQIANVMIRLEGLMSHISKHAAGIAICSEPIINHVPCMSDSDDREMLMTQWDKYNLEKVGILKADFLGLKTLTLIRKTIENIGESIDLDKINHNDTRVFDTFNSGDLSGIFQADAPAARQMIKRMGIHSFDDIIAANALCRPGVKERELYIEHKKMFENDGIYPGLTIAYDSPEMVQVAEDILKETYGAIVYQEQTMLLMNKLTGGRWTLGKADKMRKVKNLEEYRTDFVNCCVSNGYSMEFANGIFSRFDLGYTFNKSHAASYAVVMYQTAWLKTYYYKEFMAALMSMARYESESSELIAQYVKECRRHGVAILQPDINKSGIDFTLEPEGIRFGLTSIKGVGEVAVNEILNKRENHYGSMSSVIDRCSSKVNKKVITQLIKVGAFDSIMPEFMGNRHSSLDFYIHEIRSEKHLNLPTYTPEFGAMYETELLGISLSYHPMQNYSLRPYSELPEGACVTAGLITQIKMIKDKNQKDMAFVTIENAVEETELILFSRTYNQYKNVIIQGNKIRTWGRKENDKILVDSLEVLR